MTDQAKPVSRPWRRFLRFSVRGMIVVVLVIGVWLGWIVRERANPARGGGGDQGGPRKSLYDWQWKIGATGGFDGGAAVGKPAPIGLDG